MRSTDLAIVLANLFIIGSNASPVPTRTLTTSSTASELVLPTVPIFLPLPGGPAPIKFNYVGFERSPILPHGILPPHDVLMDMNAHPGYSTISELPKVTPSAVIKAENKHYQKRGGRTSIDPKTITFANLATLIKLPLPTAYPPSLLKIPERVAYEWAYHKNGNAIAPINTDDDSSWANESGNPNAKADADAAAAAAAATATSFFQQYATNEGIPYPLPTKTQPAYYPTETPHGRRPFHWGMIDRRSLPTENEVKLHQLDRAGNPRVGLELNQANVQVNSEMVEEPQEHFDSGAKVEEPQGEQEEKNETEKIKGKDRLLVKMIEMYNRRDQIV